MARDLVLQLHCSIIHQFLFIHCSISGGSNGGFVGKFKKSKDVIPFRCDSQGMIHATKGFPQKNPHIPDLAPRYHLPVAQKSRGQYHLFLAQDVAYWGSRKQRKSLAKWVKSIQLDDQLDFQIPSDYGWKSNVNVMSFYILPPWWVGNLWRSNLRVAVSTRDPIITIEA